MPKTKKAACRPKTAVAYARYSSAGQRDVSIEQQLQDIRHFAQREGYAIIHEYADRAKSGFRHTDARAEFQAMLAAADSGQFDTIITWKVDRFGRNREEAAIFKAQLRRSGVSVVYAMEAIPSGAAGVLTEGMLEAIAEWYSRNLSENVNRGMKDNALKCISNGCPIYGYRRGPDGHYIIQPDEADTVRSIFARYGQGYSAAVIAADLNASGLRTLRGSVFSGQTIIRIISNERYIGVYFWRDIRVPGGMPAIVTQKAWEEAQRMKQKTSRHYEKHPIDFLLTGKAFCGHCGAAMVGDSGTSKTGATHYYYTCQGKKARKGCNKKSLRKEYLEDKVLSFLVNDCLTGPEREKIADAIISAQKEEQKNSPLASMEKELSETQKKIDNVNHAIASGVWNDSTSVFLKSLEDTAADLRLSIDQYRFTQSQLLTRDRVLFFLDKMAHYDLTNPVYRRRLIDTFVNAVYVYDGFIRIAINCIEGNDRIPLSDLESLDLPPAPSGSDNATDGPARSIPHRSSSPPLPAGRTGRCFRCPCR